MKFGNYLDKEAIPEWRQKYLNYRYLKDILRGIPLNSLPAQAEDGLFFAVIDEEFHKIEQFYRSREAEIAQKCRMLLQQSDNIPSRQLRKSFLHIYADLDLIRSFRSLNLMAFAKIFKKYDKVTNSTRGADAFRLLKKHPLWSSPVIDDLCAEIEAAFQKHFTSGDRHKAMHQLRLRDIKHRNFHASACMAGFLWGSIAVLVWNILRDCLETSQQRTLACIYAGQALPLLLAAGFYLNILGYNSAFINFRYIFEFEQRSSIHECQYLAMIGGSCFVFTLTAYVLLQLNRTSGWFAPLPGILAAVPLLLPAPLFWPKSRLWTLKVLKRVFAAPLVPVHFADFVVADELCSLAVSWQCLAWTLLYAVDPEKNANFPSDSPLVYCLPMVPFLIRFLQCCRRYRDSRRQSNLLNAFKYALTVLALIFRVSFAASRLPVCQSLAELFVACAGLFSLYWDLVMDFGLLQSWALKTFMLRSQLAFRRRVFYYVVIAYDCLGRFMFLWPLCCRILSWPVTVEMTLVWGVIEIVRRFFWNFLRLEYEHLNNCDAFRALHDLEWAPLRTADLYYRNETAAANVSEAANEDEDEEDEEEASESIESIEKCLLVD